jgi:tetratricopeptide (TPR) repeat protein
LTDVLHAACELLGESRPGALAEAGSLYEVISNAEWQGSDFGERAELLSKCALAAWRAARREKKTELAARWATKVHIPTAQTTGESSDVGLAPVGEFGLDDAETLLSVSERLRQQRETSPERVRDEAEVIYRLLEESEKRIGLFDEREYFLGEFALIEGTASRLLCRREEASLCYDRAESWFRNTVNPPAELARVEYQRLALRIEERQLDAVLELAPALAKRLAELGMPEESLKCRILEGVALMESGRFSDSADLFLQACQEARRVKNERLLGYAWTNLAQAYGVMGDSMRALEASDRAFQILKRLDDRVNIAKIRWGVARLLHEIGKGQASIEAYRKAQQELASLGMRADVVALNLAVADLLLERGQDQEAIREILSALPVIDELKLVPEGVAALSLLRESLRQQKINRQALRDLHCFVEDIQK